MARRNHSNPSQDAFHRTSTSWTALCWRLGPASLAAVLLAGFAVAEEAPLGAAPNSLAVFYPGRSCASRVLEVAVFDPALQAWHPHPEHPRVVADSCQPEDPSQSLHELRVRCIDATGRMEPSPWRIGLGLGLGGQQGRDRCADRERDADGAGVVISSPAAGEWVTNGQDQAAVAGRVGFGEREAVGYEILIAIDVSGSTQQPAGFDVDGDGKVGVVLEDRRGIYSSDPDDSILAAEVKAIRMLVGRLAPGLGPTRVGLVSFSAEYLPAECGAISRRPGIRVEAPLSDDFDELAAVLDQILERGSGGGTDFFAAVDRSLRELSGRWDAASDARPGARKVLLLLTDGVPSPESSGAPLRARALLATREADNVAIHIYALGGQADEFPSFVRSLLQNSAGSFTRVSDPSQAASFLDDVAFAEVRRVEIENLTTQQHAEFVSLSPDGQFSGQIPVRSGRNVVLVTAHASDGRQRRTEFELRYLNSAERDRLLAAERERQKQGRRRKELKIRSEADVLREEASGRH